MPVDLPDANPSSPRVHGLGQQKRAVRASVGFSTGPRWRELSIQRRGSESGMLHESQSTQGAGWEGPAGPHRLSVSRELSERRGGAGWAQCCRRAGSTDGQGNGGVVARLVVLRLGGGGFVAPIESNSPTLGIDIT